MKCIGFDLDQTLYPRSPVIDARIQEYLHAMIADFKGCSIEEGKKLFDTHYPTISGRKTMLALGFPEEIAENAVQDALENADISELLEPDPYVINVLFDLKQQYPLALITGSFREIALQKLESLQIPLDWFDFVLTGEVSKSDGTAFVKWKEAYPDYELIYVGDRKSTDVDVPAQYGIRGILVNTNERKLVDVRELV